MTAGLYLEFRIGTVTTITMMDGTTSSATNWRVVDYRMGSAPWDGESYGLAKDVLTIDVYGATAEAVWQNIGVLEDMIKAVASAHKYRNRDRQSVYIRYSPAGASSTTADPNLALMYPEASITLPHDAYPRSASGGFVLPGVTLEYMRTAWRTPTTAHVTASSAPVMNGNDTGAILPASTVRYCEVEFSASALPIDLQVNGGTAYYALGEVVRIAASGMAGAGGYTGISDPGTNSVNPNVLRYTATTTNEVASNSVLAVPTAGRGIRYAVYFSARNNSTTTSFAVRFNGTSTAAGDNLTRHTIIPANATQPRYYFGGYIAPHYGANVHSIGVRITASAAGASLDIDNVVLVNVQGASAVWGVRRTQARASMTGFSIVPQTHLSPFASVSNYWGVLGNTRQFFTEVQSGAGNGLNAILMMCTGSNWRGMFFVSPFMSSFTYTLRPYTVTGV